MNRLGSVWSLRGGDREDTKSQLRMSPQIVYFGTPLQPLSQSDIWRARRAGAFQPRTLCQGL